MIKKLALSVLVSAAFFSAAVTPQEVSAYSVSEANDIISTGKRYLGTRYQFGADYGQTRTFDCSSFVKTVYAKNGVYLPRSSREQAQKGYWVAKRNLKKGDLIFFKSAGSSSNRITHVAIYAGNDRLLHTYGAGGVRYSDFNSYWDKRYVKAKRVL
ncbi:C40 family peptidase [Paenibacillus sp. GD4]|uniref:C40 family peptidase n=1 Tax=Paenibacillus sp. GD4 TaxID=3068890 RepID=UPI0027964B1A|nr:C40 family peptidase [Paenibacillus sp. GD4]MDQ1909511.1 C40 family peptidase [Paenibacillus sp. GD4]